MNIRVETETKEKSLQAGGEFIRDRIKENVPIQTGNLRDSIVVSDVKDEKVEVGPKLGKKDSVSQRQAFYGRFLEFGTSKMRPQPFLEKTYEANKNKIQDIMSESIKRDLGL